MSFCPADKANLIPTEPVQLAAPKSHKFTRAELSQYNGSTKPEFYVAIKGVVYDVTSNKDKYVSGQDYSVFVGKDASLLLAKSSVNVAADCGYSQKPKAERDATLAQLTPAENKVLDDWVIFFRTRYNVVGELTD